MSGESVGQEAPVSGGAIDGIIAESERVNAAAECPGGLARVEGDEERHVDASIAVLATNERLYFVSAGAGETNQEAGTIGYHQLGGVDIDGRILELSTVDGVVWRLPLGDRTDPAAEDLLGRLRWIGDLRSRVLAAGNDVDLAAGEIGDAAADMEWERGEERYAAQRDDLDRLADTVFLTEPVDSAALAPELTDLERTLERAYAELLIERSDSRLTLGQQLVRTSDHERARDVIESARADYEAARQHAEAVQRGDAFVFGEQRELSKRLDRLGWEIQAVAAEPLRRAHEAKILARSVADPAETVEHWEAAFRRYGSVLALQNGDKPSEIAGDVGEIRQDLESAAGQLIAIHRALSRSKWDAGLEDAASDLDAGVEQLRTAIEHLERAHELAEQFRPDAATDLEHRLDKMRDGLDRLREAPTFTRGGDADDDGESPATTAGVEPVAVGAGDGEAAGASVHDLASMDTHHEIQTEGAVGEPEAHDDQADANVAESATFALSDLSDAE